MKEKDEPLLYLLVNVLNDIEVYIGGLPFLTETQKPATVTKIIFKQLVRLLIEVNVDFNSIHVLEIFDWEFQVTVNNRVKSTLLIKQKEVVK